MTSSKNQRTDATAKDLGVLVLAILLTACAASPPVAEFPLGSAGRATMSKDGTTSYRPLDPSTAKQLSFLSQNCLGFGTNAFKCSDLQMKGFLFTPSGPGDKVVVISHGSQGLDGRVFEYADALTKNGIAALVLDHFGPRNVGPVHGHYAGYSAKGANAGSMAGDAIWAVEALKAAYPNINAIGYGDSIAALATASYGCSTLSPAVPGVNVLMHEWPELAGAAICRRGPVPRLEAQYGWPGFCRGGDRTMDRRTSAGSLAVGSLAVTRGACVDPRGWVGRMDAGEMDRHSLGPTLLKTMATTQPIAKPARAYIAINSQSQVDQAAGAGWRDGSKKILYATAATAPRTPST